jgi:hypothetical protein
VPKKTLGKGSVTVTWRRDGDFSLPSTKWHSANAECPTKSTRQRGRCRCTVRRAFFAECYTRQSVCRVFSRICRVPKALGKGAVSGSAPDVASMATAPSSTLATVDIEGLLLLSTTCKHHIASFIVRMTSSTLLDFMSSLPLSTVHQIKQLPRLGPFLEQADKVDALLWQGLVQGAESYQPDQVQQPTDSRLVVKYTILATDGRSLKRCRSLKSLATALTATILMGSLKVFNDQS